VSVKALVDFDVTAAQASQAPPDPRSVDAACRIIDAARSPMIILGAGALAAGPQILALARPDPGAGHVPPQRPGHRQRESCPYGFGCCRAHKRGFTSDVVIAMRYAPELAYLRWRHFPAGMKIVRIDI